MFPKIRILYQISSPVHDKVDNISRSLGAFWGQSVHFTKMGLKLKVTESLSDRRSENLRRGVELSGLGGRMSRGGSG